MKYDEFDSTELDNHLESLLAGWKRHWGQIDYAQEFVQETERAVAQLKQIVEAWFKIAKPKSHWSVEFDEDEKRRVKEQQEKPKVTNQCYYCEAKLIPTISKWGEQFETSDLSSFNCPKCGARMKIQELSVEVCDE